MAQTILILNEFGPNSAPVGELAHQLSLYLDKQPNLSVKNRFFSKVYSPGGTQTRRILKLIEVVLRTPFSILYHKVVALFQKKIPVVLVITTPPLIHWVASLFGAVFGVKTIVWYQDAHPDLEINILTRKGFSKTARILGLLDQWILRLAHSFVVLDDSMRKRLHEKLSKNQTIIVSPPWITYKPPGSPMRFPKNEAIKFIYAGNYGKTADLKPLAKKLKEIEVKTIEKLEIVFIGMTKSQYNEIRKLFLGSKIQIEFHPRLPSVDDLMHFMKNFDVAIVSLKEEYDGLACPSKAFTYLSQGLPILYIGPKDTLPDVLANKGWGWTLDDFFKNFPHSVISNIKSNKRDGFVYTDPSKESCEIIYNHIKDLQPPGSLVHARDDFHPIQ